MEMNNVSFYRLDHKHLFADCEESMHIGTFSSYERADKVIGELLKQPGFVSFPRSCFIVTEVFVDDYGWKKGFIHLKEGDIEVK